MNNKAKNIILVSGALILIAYFNYYNSDKKREEQHQTDKIDKWVEARHTPAKHPVQNTPPELDNTNFKKINYRKQASDMAFEFFNHHIDPYHTTRRLTYSHPKIVRATSGAKEIQIVNFPNNYLYSTGSISFEPLINSQDWSAIEKAITKYGKQTVITLNEKGEITRMTEWFGGKKRKLIFTQKSKNTILKEIFHKGILTESLNYAYNADNKLKSITRQNSSNEIIGKEEYFYDDDIVKSFTSFGKEGYSFNNYELEFKYDDAKNSLYVSKKITGKDSSPAYKVLELEALTPEKYRRTFYSKRDNKIFNHVINYHVDKNKILTRINGTEMDGAFSKEMYSENFFEVDEFLNTQSRKIQPSTLRTIYSVETTGDGYNEIEKKYYSDNSLKTTSIRKKKFNVQGDLSYADYSSNSNSNINNAAYIFYKY